MSEHPSWRRAIATGTVLAVGTVGIADVAGCGGNYPQMPSHSPEGAASASAAPNPTNTRLEFRREGKYCDDQPGDIPAPIRGNNVYAINGQCLGDPNQPVGTYKPSSNPNQSTSIPEGSVANGAVFVVRCAVVGEEIQTNETAINTDTQNVRTSSTWWAVGSFDNESGANTRINQEVTVPFAGLGLVGGAADSIVNDPAQHFRGPIPMC